MSLRPQASAPPGAEPPLWAEGLTRRFGKTTAVDQAFLSLRPGEIFGLIGPDGAGKTTLFRLLLTLLLPDAGAARVLGFDVQRDFREVRRRVGYMPGRFSLYPDLTVEENVRFFASVFGTSLEENYELIKDIYRQIEPFKDRRAAALSGGMKQKLALSCALIHEPELLFLDEPTTGVDAVSRVEFWEMLARLRERGLTILVSTPYMDEASRCDRIALMQNGKLSEANTPKAVAAGFRQPLLAVSASGRVRLAALLRDYPHAASVQPFGETFHYADRRPSADPDDLRAYLSENGVADALVRPIEPTVEDAFIALLSETGTAA